MRCEFLKWFVLVYKNGQYFFVELLLSMGSNKNSIYKKKLALVLKQKIFNLKIAFFTKFLYLINIKNYKKITKQDMNVWLDLLES